MSFFHIQRDGFYGAGIKVCLDSKRKIENEVYGSTGFAAVIPSPYIGGLRIVCMLRNLCPCFERICRITFITKLLETTYDLSVHLDM